VTPDPQRATLPAFHPPSAPMAENEEPQVPENPAPGVLPEGSPGADRLGDLGLTAFGIVWAIIVIAVGMWLQG
jgi:hypothetical protein